MRSRPGRGVTLVELVVVLAVMAVLATLAWANLSRGRPRATLASTAGELQAILHAARLQALNSGNLVHVVVFTAHANPEGGVGRVVVIEDRDGSFFTDGATPNLKDYDPAKVAFGAPTDQTPTILDLPPGITFGPGGARAGGALAAPLDTISVASACTFCGSTGARGAVTFDERGKATFHSGNGAPLAVGSGATLRLSAAELGGTRTLAIISGSGALVAVNDG